jgi:arylamine N-acetyltransferase
MPSPLLRSVLCHLKVPEDLPSPAHLQAIINAYVARVPWESASRIAKRAACTVLASCPRWPEEFWRDHLAGGWGGTCFESNYALMELLRALGYEAAFTVNDMDESVGCHSALVVRLDGAEWLVDVGIPVFAPILVDPARSTSAQSAFHSYVLEPREVGEYRLTRDRHPRPYVYDLRAAPVSERSYRATVERDYDLQTGLFLDRVVINKVIGGVQQRFSSIESPLRIQSFRSGVESHEELGEDPAAELAARFGLEAATLRVALEACEGLSGGA